MSTILFALAAFVVTGVFAPAFAGMGGGAPEVDTNSLLVLGASASGCYVAARAWVKNKLRK